MAQSKVKTVLDNKKQKFIRANYLKFPSRALAKKMNVSKTVILAFLKRENLVVPDEIIAEWRKRSSLVRPYTKKEHQFIIDNIESMSIKEIASKLKRCNNKIRDEIRLLNLQHIIDKKAKESRFKKGNVSHTKGKKLEDFMKPETIKKFRQNQYKVNSIPHNAKKDFEETQRTDKSGRVYTMIKVPGQRKLILKHRYVWEQHNKKKIPKGFNIVFKDGNTQNFDIENLECISNYDLMKRNTLHNYPDEIKEIINIKAQITRQINKHLKP